MIKIEEWKYIVPSINIVNDDKKLSCKLISSECVKKY